MARLVQFRDEVGEEESKRQFENMSDDARAKLSEVLGIGVEELRGRIDEILDEGEKKLREQKRALKEEMRKWLEGAIEKMGEDKVKTSLKEKATQEGIGEEDFEKVWKEILHEPH